MVELLNDDDCLTDDCSTNLRILLAKRRPAPKNNLSRARRHINPFCQREIQFGKPVAIHRGMKSLPYGEV
jgi:hypothetical protein